MTLSGSAPPAPAVMGKSDLMGLLRDSKVFTERIVLCQGENESALQRGFPSKLKVLSLSCIIKVPETDEALALALGQSM